MQNGTSRGMKVHRGADRGVHAACIAAKNQRVSTVVVRLKTMLPPTKTRCAVVMDATKNLTSPHFCDQSQTADRHRNQDASTSHAMSAMRLACETVRLAPLTTTGSRQLGAKWICDDFPTSSQVRAPPGTTTTLIRNGNHLRSTTYFFLKTLRDRFQDDAA